MTSISNFVLPSIHVFQNAIDDKVGGVTGIRHEHRSAHYQRYALLRHDVVEHLEVCYDRRRKSDGKPNRKCFASSYRLRHRPSTVTGSSALSGLGRTLQGRYVSMPLFPLTLMCTCLR